MVEIQYTLYSDSQKVIAEGNDSSVIFKEAGKRLESTLKLSGINIPHPKRVLYNGRSVIQYSDPLFPRAFFKEYCLNCLRESGFILNSLTVPIQQDR
jgi:hypothetical protein